MAYNLQPLITILQQILNPLQTRWILDHNKPQLEYLLEKAASLQHILEKKSHVKTVTLESRIRDAAHKAEDIIESQMADHLLSMPRGMSFTFITPDLQQVTQELDSVREQVEKLIEETTSSSGTSFLSSKRVLVEVDEDPMHLKRKLEIVPIVGMGGIDVQHDAVREQVMKLMEGKTTTRGISSSGASFSSSKSVVVGVDKDLSQLKDRLIGMRRELEIVPIVGMGGVGKTTLARKLYEVKLIVSSFQYRGWTTISQDYNVRAILLSLLRCIIGKVVDDQHIEKENAELKDVLYRSLFGRKYMIILDDIWSTSVWDEIRSFFPDNDKGSRIVITTRESHVAKHVDSQSMQHQVQLLSQFESWNLLRQIVFGDEDCPHPLQAIGEKIASDCGGLPLAISVIGGLLCKVERSEDVWGNISNDVTAAIAKSDEQFSDILLLSYNHLPDHLKPCFLYMGAFPEDYEIKAGRLVRLLVAEGFVKSKGDKILEEEARDFIKALVERNLLLVKEKKYNGKPKSYSIHDLLRDLCMRKAEEEKFLHVKNSPKLTFSNSRRVSVQASYGMEDVYASAELMSLARSFLSTSSDILSSFFSALRLLRVLDVMDESFKEFPTEVLQLVNLHYLAINSSLPSKISRLWNLQSLIASTDGCVPFEIWELPELRHLKFIGVVWFERLSINRWAVEKKLQTISMIEISNELIEIGFFESIPHIRSLGLYTTILQSDALDLSHLHKLESLRCKSGFIGAGRSFLAMLIFPSTLRKLTLMNFKLFPRVLTAVRELPNLELLDLKFCDFEREAKKDEEWEVGEGDVFRSLQFLGLTFMNLKRWTADETNFPRLRHLFIRYCMKLEEIPCGIGEIPTLQLIELENCKDPLVDSAKQIVEVQQSEFDNYDLKLRISS